MFKTVKALILRGVVYKEADRILTVLTDEGKMTVKAQSALRKSSKISAATRDLCYSELTLFSKSDKWIVKEAVAIEPFEKLRTDMFRLSLGSYFAECLDVIAQEGQRAEGSLRLGLNSLYALDRELYPDNLIKAAFELRLLCEEGFSPRLDNCAVCGKEPEIPILFGPRSGRVCCKKCRNESFFDGLEITPEVLNHMRHICRASDKGFIPKSADDMSTERLSFITEQYILAQTEHSFGTLSYYRRLVSFTNKALNARQG